MAEAGLFPGDDIYPNGYRMPLGVYIIKSAEKKQIENTWILWVWTRCLYLM